MKGIHMEKGKVKPPLLADDMILWNSCEEIHMNTCKQKLLELKNIYTKAAGCKINIQKLNAISSH